MDHGQKLMEEFHEEFAKLESTRLEMGEREYLNYIVVTINNT